MSSINNLLTEGKGKLLNGLRDKWAAWWVGDWEDFGPNAAKPNGVLVDPHVDRFIENRTVHPVRWLNHWFVRFDAEPKPIPTQKLNRTKPGSGRRFNGLTFSILKNVSTYLTYLVSLCE